MTPSGSDDAWSTRAGAAGRLTAALGSRHEARWMLEQVLGRPDLPAGPAGDLPVAAASALRAMVARRLAGEPLQYVLGSWAFRHLELAVDRRALIPRPETEQVVEAALAEVRRLGSAPDGPVVADLGTGTGAIALSIAVELRADLPGLEVWATDADPDALALAAVNVGRATRRWPRTAGRVRLRPGSWFEALPVELAGRLDVVVSNPPYVSEGEWPGLDPEVRREPRQALVAADGSDGTPGLGAVEAVVRGARQWLGARGAVVVELAPHQAGPAAALARRSGFGAVRVVPDLAGRDRAIVALV